MAELGVVCQQVAKVVREVLHKKQEPSTEPETPEGCSFLKQLPWVLSSFPAAELGPFF